MDQHTKSIGLRFLMLAFAASLMLAASLSHLQFQSGSPIPGGETSEAAGQASQPLALLVTSAFPILKGILALVFSALSIYLIARLITLVEIKNILRLALAAAILLALVYMLPSTTFDQAANITNAPSEITTQPAFDHPITPLGQPPKYLAWIVIGVLALGISLPVFEYVRRWQRPSEPEDPLLQEAQNALNALQSGVDLKDVIMRCYFQMAQAISLEQGIERQEAMTVREFERWLEIKGFPSDPVHLLTSLFEKVRYGTQQSSDRDEKIAVDCLNEIVQFCRNERTSANG